MQLFRPATWILAQFCQKSIGMICDKRRSEDRELNQAWSKPDIVDRPVRTAHTFVHHWGITAPGMKILVFAWSTVNYTTLRDGQIHPRVAFQKHYPSAVVNAGGGSGKQKHLSTADYVGALYSETWRNLTLHAHCRRVICIRATGCV